jgi:hypothetical protein
MASVQRVIRIKTADALAEAHRIRQKYGYCVGISAGANTLAALQLRDEGAAVATLWPDCADRYVSVGLQSPVSAEVQCPLQPECRARSLSMLGDDSGGERPNRTPAPSVAPVGATAVAQRLKMSRSLASGAQ